MKIKYQFANETVEIEVSEGWGSVLIELDRQEHNNNRRETRRHESYSGDNEKMDTLEDWKTNIEGDFLCKVDSERLMVALEKLLPQQRELVQKVYFENIPITEIAKGLGITKQACNDRFNKIYKRLKNFF